MKEKFFKIAKKRKYLIAVSYFLLIIGTVSAVSNFYRVNFGQTITIDEYGTCKKVTRTAAGDIFVPTKTSAEWAAFRNNAQGVSFSACASVPSQITGLTAAAGNAQVTLGWSAPADNGDAITNYKVYRSTTSGTETLLTTLGNVLTYNNTGLTNGVTYYYKVSAVNAIGEGALSNEASANPYDPSWIGGICSGIAIYYQDMLCTYSDCGYTWYVATSSCSSAGGRLPTRSEASCVSNNRNAFGSFGRAYYWTSDSKNSGVAYYYNPARADGDIWYAGKSTSSNFGNRCVR